MKFNTGTTLAGKISAVLGTIFVILGAVMLVFAGLTGFTLLPLTFGGIVMVLGGIYLARNLRLMELINHLLQLQ
jgi:hypothetical protein